MLDALVTSGVVGVQAVLGVKVLKSILPSEIKTNIGNKLNIVLNTLCLFLSLAYIIIILNKSYLYNHTIVDNVLRVSIYINLSFVLASLIVYLNSIVDNIKLKRVLVVARVGLLTYVTLGYGFYYIYSLLKLVGSGLLI